MRTVATWINVIHCPEAITHPQLAALTFQMVFILWFLFFRSGCGQPVPNVAAFEKGTGVKLSLFELVCAEERSVRGVAHLCQLCKISFRAVKASFSELPL